MKTVSKHQGLTGRGNEIHIIEVNTKEVKSRIFFMEQEKEDFIAQEKEDG